MKYVRLDHYEFVRVIGPDAIKFLQGQVTCNMEKVQPTVSVAGALCNLKGRVIADFRVIAIQDGVVLQTQETMAQRVVDVLKKYAVFSKVEITVVNFGSDALGCFGEDAPQLLGRHLAWEKPETGNVFVSDDFIVVSLHESSQRVEVYPLRQSANAMLGKLIGSAEESELSLWERQDIEAGIIHVHAGLSEEFTPQLLNYDISGVIDFKKGCYTGQEIVARMFYRSTAKKRLTLLSSPVPIDDESNIEYSENDATFITPVLKFSNASLNDSKDSVLLAIVGTEAADSKAPARLTNNKQTPLQILTMPYTQLKD